MGIKGLKWIKRTRETEEKKDLNRQLEEIQMNLDDLNARFLKNLENGGF